MFKKGVIFVSLFLLILGYSFIAPFIIKADSSTNTAPFIGVNIQVTGVDSDINSITLPNINFSYGGGTVPSGYVSGQLNCSSPSTPTSSIPCDIFSLQNSSGTGGSMNGLKLVFPLHSYYLNPNGNAQVNNGYNYIFDYEFILDDNYKGYVVLDNSITIYVNGNSFHHSVRQQGITQQEFTITDYQLVRIINPMFWNIPLESLQAVKYCMDRYNYLPINEVNYFSEYPMFDLKSGNDIANFFYNKNYSYILIFGTNYNFAYNSTGINDMFNCTQSISNFQINELYSLNSGFKIVKVTLNFSNNGNIQIKVNHDNMYIPIYSSLNLYQNYSTDFALRFGLSNRMLDDIDHLANGITQTNNSSSQADSTNQQAQNTFEQEEQLITNAENTLSNNLQSLDISNKNNQLFGNSKFIASALWVKTQFDTLTNNNAFGYLITFSLVIGISLVIIGKLRG